MSSFTSSILSLSFSFSSCHACFVAEKVKGAYYCFIPLGFRLAKLLIPRPFPSRQLFFFALRTIFSTFKIKRIRSSQIMCSYINFLFHFLFPFDNLFNNNQTIVINYQCFYMSSFIVFTIHSCYIKISIFYCFRYCIPFINTSWTILYHLFPLDIL